MRGLTEEIPLYYDRNGDDSGEVSGVCYSSSDSFAGLCVTNFSAAELMQ
jgi:hypothetical protein